MADKARHAFGLLENVDSAITEGKIDAFDILFVKDADNNAYVGWVDKEGKKVIATGGTVDTSALEGQIAELGTELEGKANVESIAALETEMSKKASVAEVAELETQVASKVDAETVQTMIKDYSESVIEVVEF